MPHRGSLKASPDDVAGNRDAEDDLASFEELVVEYKGAAEVLCCSEQRASSERALGMLLLVSCECVAGGLEESEPEPASAPLETLPLHLPLPPATLSHALRMIFEYSLSIQLTCYNSMVNECPKAHASLLAPPNRLFWLQHKRRSATLFRGDKRRAKDKSTGILLTSSLLWQISATALCKSWE